MPATPRNPLRPRPSCNMRPLILSLLCAGVAAADTYPRQPGVDVQHYIFRVTLSDQSDAVAGETTAVLKFVKDGVAEAFLDLASAANGKGMTVDSVTSDGAPVTYQHAADRLRLTFAAARKDEIRPFTVKYHGTPAGGLKFVANKFGDHVIFSANWPDLAHQWLPTIDHPYDKATSEFIVTAPAKYQVVANGLLVGADRPGRRPPHHALEAVRAHRHLAEQHRGGAVRLAQLCPRCRRAARKLALPSGPRCRHRHLRTAPAPRHRVLQRPHWPVSVREAGRRGSRRNGRRHGARQRNLLRRARRHRPSGFRPGGARDRAPVVRRFRHRERLGRRVAERRLRHLFRPAHHRALRGPRRLRRRTEAQPH